MNTLHQQIIEQVESCIALASQALNHDFAMPIVRFDQRGKAAGTARLQGWELRFNPILLEENPEAFLTEVVPHEVAHLVVFKCCGRVRPHGKEWQAVMANIFKVAPRTTHSFDIASVKGKTFAYRCGCQQHELTVRRHNKIKRQQAVYHCRQCRQALQPA